MKIYHLCQIGQFHTNHNEDSYIIEEVGANKSLIAVMDGCSSGSDSHFASNLIGKVLRKVAKNQFYQEFISKEEKANEQLLKDCFRALF